MKSSPFSFFTTKRNHRGFAQSIPMPSKKRTLPLNVSSSHSVAQFLYKTGAILINNGVAYAKDDPATPNMDMRRQLLDEYNQLPAFHAMNNVTVAENPFHALFVMRVALDHVPAHTIHSIYMNLKARYNHSRLGGISIEFPNGSDMLGPLATLQIMRTYIFYHSSRFSFLSDSDKQDVIDAGDIFNNAPYSYIIGSTDDVSISRSRASDLTDDILKRNIPNHGLSLVCR